MSNSEALRAATMASFCRQCAIEDFGEDVGDLRGLNKEDTLAEDCGFSVICEGCGYTVVDHAGQCIAPNCLRKHPKPETIYRRFEDWLKSPL